MVGKFVWSLMAVATTLCGSTSSSSAGYSYSYSVSDTSTGDIKSAHEQRDETDGSVRGEYRVLDSDGWERIVTYTADDQHGFRASVRRQRPTSLNPTSSPSPDHNHHQNQHYPTPAYDTKSSVGKQTGISGPAGPFNVGSPLQSTSYVHQEMSHFPNKKYDTHSREFPLGFSHGRETVPQQSFGSDRATILGLNEGIQPSDHFSPAYQHEGDFAAVPYAGTQSAPTGRNIHVTASHGVDSSNLFPERNYPVINKNEPCIVGVTPGCDATAHHHELPFTPNRGSTSTVLNSGGVHQQFPADIHQANPEHTFIYPSINRDNTLLSNRRDNTGLIPRDKVLNTDNGRDFLPTLMPLLTRNVLGFLNGLNEGSSPDQLGVAYSGISPPFTTRGQTVRLNSPLAGDSENYDKDTHARLDRLLRQFRSQS